SYRLFAPNAQGDPGYLTLQPKSLGDKNLWFANVEKYLNLFAETLNMTPRNPALDSITIQPEQWKSFSIKGGSIRINNDLKEIAISETHPERDEVIHDLLTLYWNTKKGIGSQRRFY
ncbi:MAG: hypothetical protein Q7K45_04980, partial [Nanoarchaeota archaeon]|nr:hypothetical protein [Nanoarchaeota archaeon]